MQMDLVSFQQNPVAASKEHEDRTSDSMTDEVLVYEVKKISLKFI